MMGYIVRRICYGFLILLGVNALTFALFFAVNTPDDMARLAIGGRYVTADAIERWKEQHGYDLPLVYNDAAPGIEKVTQTIFFQREYGAFSDITNIKSPFESNYSTKRYFR